MSVDVQASASVKLTDRIPNGSQLTDLTGQLTAQVNGIKVPGMPADQIQKLTAGFDLKLPDTSNWHTVIPASSNDLLKNFPSTDTLARPLEEPLSHLRQVFAVDVMGEFSRLEAELAKMKALQPDSPAAFLEGLTAPLSTLAGFFQDAQLTQLMGLLGDLIGSKNLAKAPQDFASVVTELLTIVHDRVEAIILAFVSLGSVVTATERTERLVTAITGSFSPDDTRARLQALLAHYGEGTDGLAGRIRVMNVADAAQVQAVQTQLSGANDAFAAFAGGLVRDLALTEASLTFLNADALQKEYKRLGQTLANLDGQQLTRLADSVQAAVDRFVQSNQASPAVTIDELKSMIHTGLAQVNAEVVKLDPGKFDQGFKEALALVNEPFKKLEDFEVEVEAAVRGAFQSVREAIEQINLQPLRSSVDRALGGLETSLTELDALFTGIRTSIESALNDLKTALDGLRQFLLDPHTGLQKKIHDFFDAIIHVLDEINLQGVVDEVSAALHPVTVSLGQIEFAPIINATVEALQAITEVLKTVAPLLVTDSLKQKLSEATAFLRQLDFDAIGKSLTDTFDEILRSVDEQALATFKVEYQKVIDAVDQLDPVPALQEIQKQAFDPLLAELEKVKPAELLKPVQEGYGAAVKQLAAFNPVDTLAPITAFFDQLLAKFHEISPAKLLEPIQKTLDEIRAQINKLLRIDDLLKALDILKNLAQPAVKALDFTSLLDRMADGYAEMKNGITAFDPHALVVPLGGLLSTAFAPTGIDVSAIGVLGSLEAIAARSDDMSGRFAAMQRSLQSGQAQVDQLDLKATLATLRAKHGEVQAALSVHAGAGAATADLALQITALDPMPVLAPLMSKLDRLKAAYADKVAQFTVAATAIAPTFKALADVLSVFRRLLAPVTTLSNLALEPFRRLFPGQTFAGPRDVLLAFVNEMDPVQWRTELDPLLATVHTKLTMLVDDAVLKPITETAHSLKAMTDLLDISPLTVAINGVFAEIEGVIRQLDPAPIIKAISEAYQRIVGMLHKLDPAEFIATISKVYSDDIVAVVQGISPEKLLLPPLQELFAHLKSLLVALDIEVLFKPVLDRLHTLDAELGDGLHQVGEAYKQMLAALDGATDGAGHVSISASAHVS